MLLPHAVRENAIGRYFASRNASTLFVSRCGMPGKSLDVGHRVPPRVHGVVIKRRGAVWETARPREAGNATVKAIHDIRRYLSDHSDSASAKVLSRLPGTLSREESLLLSDLYALDWESFELAIDLLRDWRIDRYYADRTDLFTAPSKMAERSPDHETAE